MTRKSRRDDPPRFEPNILHRVHPDEKSNIIVVLFQLGSVYDVWVTAQVAAGRDVSVLEMVCIQWSHIMKNNCSLSCSMKKYVVRMEVTTYLWCEATLRLFATIRLFATMRSSHNTYLELSSV